MIPYLYVRRHRKWSLRTFGQGKRTEGVLRHIESEIQEIRNDSKDPLEWIDIIILAIDGSWRSGLTPWQLLVELWKKQRKNFRRHWPKVPEDQPSFHIKE